MKNIKFFLEDFSKIFLLFCSFNPFSYMLTAAVGSAQFSAELSYANIPLIAEYLDIINVMAYDLHGPWDDVLGINAPLHAGLQDRSSKQKQLNMEAIVKYWLEMGKRKRT